MPRALPMPTGQDPQEWKTFLDRQVFRHESPHRISLMGIWERARNYFKGWQWIVPDFGEDPTRTPFWRPMQVTARNWMAMLTQNEFTAPISNEAARLFGAGSRPSVRPDNNSPKTARAAKIGTDALQSKLEELQWTEQEYEGDLWNVLYGSWPSLSFWKIDARDVVITGKDTALRCSDPSCDFRLADDSIPDEEASKFRGHPGADIKVGAPGTNPLVPPAVTGTATGCLQCEPKAPAIPGQDLSLLGGGATVAPSPGPPQAVPLEPYTPEGDEAQAGKDFFGRPLGEEIPRGDVALRNISPYDFFPEADGLEKTWESLRSFGIETIETLDDIAAWFPENGPLVEEEPWGEIARWHPVVGGSGDYFLSSGGSDPHLLSGHVRLRQWHRMPWIDRETRKRTHGVSVYMANNVLLSIGPYEVESQTRPGRYINRVQIDGVPWEIRDKELFGLSGAELIFSQQDIINIERSQAAHARHLFGSPKVFAETGTDIHFAGFTETLYDGDIWYYTPLPGGEKPFVFSGQQMGPGWQNELENDVSSISRTMGVTDVETGNAPKDVSAASALMFLGEKASERRKPRLARIRAFKRRKYRHILELMHEFYREERYYNVKGKNDRTSVRCFMGEDLMGQTNVVVEDDDLYDVKLVNREGVKEAMSLPVPTVVPDTAAAKRRINSILGIPLDINDDQNAQVEQAQEEWIRFLEDGVEPAIDTRGNSHPIHYQCHQTDFNSEESETLKAAVDWNQILLALWGWEQQLQALQAAEMMAMAPEYKPKPNPEGAITVEEQAHALQMEQNRMAAREQIAGMPKATELRVAWLWDKLLFGAGIGWGQGPEGEERRRLALPLIRWYGHLEGHYQLMRAEATAGQAGIALPAPAGAPTTAMGMIPTPGAPGQPGPGAGPAGLTATGAGAY